jgi:hypothetical protein
MPQPPFDAGTPEALASSKAPVSISLPAAHALRVRYNLPVLTFLDLGTYLRFVNLIATLSEFFFAAIALL